MDSDTIVFPLTTEYSAGVSAASSLEDQFQVSEHTILFIFFSFDAYSFSPFSLKISLALVGQECFKKMIVNLFLGSFAAKI